MGNTYLLGSVSPRGCDLCQAPREVPGGTHLQHLRVIEDLVLVAALSGGGDALGEVGALVQDQRRFSVSGLEGGQLLSVLGMQSHLGRQEEVPPWPTKDKTRDWDLAATVRVKVRPTLILNLRQQAFSNPSLFTFLTFWEIILCGIDEYLKYYTI